MENSMQTQVLGKLAMEIISDYPLYASIDGITFEEAIAIAEVLEPDHSQWEELAGKDGTA
jgi:hypothetical protein